jgi:hypothetical protein
VYDDNGNPGKVRAVYSNIDRYILIYFGKDLTKRYAAIMGGKGVGKSLTPCWHGATMIFDKQEI